MLFLLTAFALESKCKNMKYFRHGKKKLPPVAKTIGGKGLKMLFIQYPLRCHFGILAFYQFKHQF